MTTTTITPRPHQQQAARYSRMTTTVLVVGGVGYRRRASVGSSRRYATPDRSETDHG